jgi:chitodextrinase
LLKRLNSSVVIMLVLAMVANLFVIAPPDNAEAAYSHTIADSSFNDFNNSSNIVGNETFGTSENGHLAHISWDANNIYIGYTSPDVVSTTQNSNSKWLLMYFGGAGGTMTGENYMGQKPGLPFSAKYHVRFRVDGTYTNRMMWDGNGWQSVGNYAWNTHVWRNDSAQFVKFKIPRADVGLSGASTMQFVSTIMYEAGQNSGGSMWGAIPSDSFAGANGYNKSFTTFYEFDLNPENTASAAQVYNYNFKRTNMTSNSATFSFAAQTGATFVKIQQSTTNGATWTDSTVNASLSQSSTTATVTNLVAGTTYKFRLNVFGGQKPGTSSIVSVKVPDVGFFHTITLDGLNDFAGSSSKVGNETFSTSTNNVLSYVTWDSDYVYFGYSGDDVVSNTTNAATKWLLLYIGGTGGTTLGLNYAGQQPLLPFDTKYHIRFRVDGTYTNRQMWNGTAWQNMGNYNWGSDKARNDGNKFLELRIPRADLGLESARSLQVVSSLAYEDITGNNDAMWGAMPSDTFGAVGNGYDRDFTTFYEFDMKSKLAPAAQVYNYNFKTISVSDKAAFFSFTKPLNASSVKIERSSDGGSTWSQATTTPETITNQLEAAAVTGLTANTSYKFRLSVVGGELDGSSAVSSVRTGQPDTTKPSNPIGLVASNITTTSVDLSWQASTDNVAVFGYEIYRNGVKVDTTTDTKYAMTGLTDTTTYSIYVVAYDASDNKSGNSSTISVVTKDGKAPSKPSNLSATSITSTGFTLSWTASTDNVGVTKYEVYKDGFLVAETASTSYNVVGLQQNSNNSMSVLAVDAADNKSDYSDPRIVTTSDGAPPTVPTNVTFSELDAKSFKLSWTASTDNTAVAGYEVYKNGVLLGKVLHPNTSLQVADLTELTTYTMTVRAYDNGGNTSAASTPIEVKTVDKTAPAAVTDVTSSAITANSFALSWTAATDNVAVTAYEIYNDGALLYTTTFTSYTLTSLNQLTTYKITVRATDAAGNKSIASDVLNVTTLDGLAPSTPSGVASANVQCTSLTLNWTASTDNVAVTKYDVSRDGTKIGESATTSFAVTGLSHNSTYGFTVRAADAAGNLSPPSGSFSVTTPQSSDGQAPTVPSGLNTTNLEANSLTLNWTASTDNVGVTEYQITRDGKVVATTDKTTFDFSGLTDATEYKFTVKASDAVGNRSQDSAVLTVKTKDSIKPSAPTNLVSSAVTKNSFTLSWSASTDNVAVTGYEVYRDTSLIGTAVGTTFSVTGLAEATLYDMTVRAKDAANNLSVASALLKVTTTDSTPPAVPSGLNAVNITKTSFTVLWSDATDNIAVTGYEVYRDSTLLGTAVSPSFTLNNAETATNYSIRIRAVDAAGNKSAFSNPVTLTTLDGQAPTVPTGLKSANVTNVGFTVSWTASTDNTGVTGYEVNRNGVKIADSSTTSYVFSGLIPSTKYTITVTAYDGLGNKSANSQSLDVTTYAVADNTPPSIPTAITSSAATTSGFTLNWAASTDNNAVAGYKVYRSGTEIGETVTNSFSVTGLIAGTTYNMTVRAFDAAGNLSAASGVLPITTSLTNVGDNQAPTTPSNVTASGITANSFTLNWNASLDNVAVVGYEVYRNGTLAGTPAANALNLNSGLIANTTYVMTVIAYDANGNKSSASAPISVTTTNSVVADSQLPTAPTNVTVSNITSNGAKITWTASTDNIGVTGYEIFRDTAQIALSSINEVTLSGLLPNSSNLITVRAVDAASNKSLSSSAVIVQTLPLIVIPDLSAPSQPTGLTISNLTTDGLTLSWTPSTDNIAVVSYEVFQDGVSVGTTVTSTLNVKNLTAGKVYVLTVKASDGSGNQSPISAPQIVTTPSGIIPADQFAPSAPREISLASKTGNGLTITWVSSTDNTGVVEYDIYRNGVKVGSVATNRYTDANISNQANYEYYVRAKDGFGNVSEASVPFSVTADTLTGLSNSNPLIIKIEKQTIGVTIPLTRVQIDGTKLEEHLRKNLPTLLEIKGNHEAVRFELPASALKRGASFNPDKVITLRTDLATIDLPVNALRVDALAMAVNTATSDLKINVTIQQPSAMVIGRFSDTLRLNQALSNSELIDIRVTTETPDGVNRVVDGFGDRYVNRMIPLSQKIDANRSTVVVYDDKTQRIQYVPAMFIVRNGQQQALVRTTQNKLLAVIETERTFRDMRGHWAQKEVEQLASKLVVKGATSTQFQPNVTVSRADFATLLVRALGMKEDASLAKFRDVRSKDWFAGAVGTAVTSGLMPGYKDGTFKPNAKMTRAELAVVLERAMDFTGKSIELTPKQKTAWINKFKDKTKITVASQSAVATVLEARIMTGKTKTTFAPTTNVTRAELTVILKRLLQHTEFMN